jgi:type VI secretion system ImpM family protein
MSGGVGFYGKLPGAGDFVRRRLPSDFVDSWDRHFQLAVDTGRRELGERWTAAWRHGTAWRFVLPPQVCGNGAWCGLTGPAADRLGRAFPMVLATPCDGDVARIFGHDAWFDALECVYRSAQHQALDVGTFDAGVAALPHPLADASDLSAFWRGLPWDSGQWQLEMPGGAAASVMLTETWRQLCLRPGPWCLWWTEGAARLLATRGLPRSHAVLLEAPRALRYDEVEFANGLADGFGERSGSGLSSVALLSNDATAASLDGASPFDGSRTAQDTMERGDTMLWLDNGRTLVLSADEGQYDARRVAARGIRETVAASAPDPASLRARLMSLHARLGGASHSAPGAANENGVAIVVRFDGTYARLLRVGAAALWHWRRGQLQAPFVERAAGAGGEFDDLLFGDAWLNMPGIGTAGEPDCDEAMIRLEPGDRMLLLATRELTQLPRDCLAEALALTTCDDARAHLAIRAGLGRPSAQWPLAVVEVHP